MSKIELWTDGCVIRNGQADSESGWACVMLYKGKYKIIKGGDKGKTNNYMELLAVIKGLEAIKKPGECDVEVFSDSQYVVSTIKLKWNRNANNELWANLDKLIEIHKNKVTFTKVKAHCGIMYNELANDHAFKGAKNWRVKND